MKRIMRRSGLGIWNQDKQYTCNECGFTCRLAHTMIIHKTKHNFKSKVKPTLNREFSFAK